MVDPVGYHQEARLESEIITRDLVESVLGDWNMGSLTFHKKMDLSLWGKGHDIVTLGEVVQDEFLLNVEQALRKTFFR